jgi:hypothetical protein
MWHDWPQKGICQEICPMSGYPSLSHWCDEEQARGHEIQTSTLTMHQILGYLSSEQCSPLNSWGTHYWCIIFHDSSLHFPNPHAEDPLYHHLVFLSIDPDFASHAWAIYCKKKKYLNGLLNEWTDFWTNRLLNEWIFEHTLGSPILVPI